MVRHLLTFAQFGFRPAEYRQYVVDSNALEFEKALAIADMLRTLDKLNLWWI